MDDHAKTTSRVRFLRQVGVTLAAAVGAGALASAAKASGNCCATSGDPHGCGSCGTGKQFCWCNCSAAGTNSYCWPGGCVTIGNCIACPC
jgi:hypothetical protein